MDPIQDYSSNSYSYVENNPLIKIDPSGSFAFIPFLFAWGAAVASDPGTQVDVMDFSKSIAEKDYFGMTTNAASIILPGISGMMLHKGLSKLDDLLTLNDRFGLGEILRKGDELALKATEGLSDKARKPVITSIRKHFQKLYGQAKEKLINQKLIELTHVAKKNNLEAVNAIKHATTSKELLEVAEKAGFKIEEGTKHWLVRNPKTGKLVIPISHGEGTKSRTLQNSKARLVKELRNANPG